MAQPITWHNVNGPSMGNPAQFMQLAQTGVDGAFDKLGAVLKQREDTNKANWDQGAVNNAEALKSALYGVTTPEQMAAAQKSGQFNEMLTGFGAQVKDPAALRALMDGRLGVLQGQATANTTFNDNALDRQQQPERDALQIRALKGDPAAIAAIETSTLRNRAPLIKDALLGTEQIASNNRAATKAEDDLKNSLSTRTYRGLQGNAVTVNAETDRLEAQNRNKALDVARERLGVEAVSNQFKNISRDTVMADGDLTESSGQAKFSKLFSDKTLEVSPGQRTDILTELNKVAPGGYWNYTDKQGKMVGQRPVPASVAMRALEGSNNEWSDGNLYRSNSFRRNLKELMENEDITGQIDAVQQKKRNTLTAPQTGVSGSWGDAPSETLDRAFTARLNRDKAKTSRNPFQDDEEED